MLSLHRLLNTCEIFVHDGLAAPQRRSARIPPPPARFIFVIPKTRRHRGHDVKAKDAKGFGDSRHVRWSGDDDNGLRQVTLLDHARRPAGPGEVTVRTRGWRAGLYLCRIEFGGRVASGKLVVSR